MPRGQADFGMYAPKEVAASISDMGEVAARLGSIDVFDKRGDVLMFDNFEDPILKWLKGGTIGYSIIHDTTYPKSGSQCVKLTLPAVLNSWARIEKSVQFRGSYRLGMEISFDLVNLATRPEIVLKVFTGSREILSSIRFDYANRRLEYRDSGWEWATLAEGILVVAAAFFYQTMKLVIDASTEKYVRVIFGNVEYDLSAYNCNADDSGVAPSVGCQILTSQETALALSCWFEDFILTINEP